MSYRIELSRQALSLVDRNQEPQVWAYLQVHLGISLSQHLIGEHLDNLEQALHHCQQALEVYTRTAFPKDWAVTQNSLANVYAKRICGERADNLEQAIHHYQQALEVYTRSVFPKQWAIIQNNLAEAYRSRIRGERADNLEQAIHHGWQALEVHTRTAFPEQWAMIQNNLVNIYGARIRGERADNLEQAIHHGQQALKIYTRSAFPEQWAITQNNLVEIYRNRIHGNRGDNLEQAIHHGQQALEVYTRTAFSEQWAMIQNNLANVYSNRIQGERVENLELAIYHHQQTLEVYTRSAFPEQWAMTQNNLAETYQNRIHGDRGDNVEQAIHHCQQALEVYTRSAFPEYWAMTQNNLANIYHVRIRGERADNLEQAIHHCQQALEVCKRSAFPEHWAMIQNSLANIYHVRIRGERVDNLEQAIHHCQQALEVYTRSAFPEHWAMIQNNLANVYSNRIQGERVENLELAIYHYQQTLEVYAAVPQKHLLIQHNLANLFFDEQRWVEALNSYQKAIAAGNALLAIAYSEFGRQAEVGETAQLFAHSAYCLLQIHQHSEVLLMLEYGKTRLLSEALALGNIDIKSLPERYHAPLQTARQAVRELEAEMRLPLNTPARRSDRELADLLRDQRSELTALIATIRQEYPDFMPTGLDLPAILALIPKSGVLIAPFVTSQGSALLVVPHGATHITSEHIIRLDNFKDEHLNALLLGSEEQPGWLRAYFDYHQTRHIKNWQGAIETLTQRIWGALFDPIHARLQALGVKRLLLMPSGGLQLLPLHAAWHTMGSQKHTLLDNYEITYAPSAYALDIAQQRATVRVEQTTLVVGINDYKKLSQLLNAAPEAKAIAQTFGRMPLLNALATKQMVKSGVIGTAYIHLSCHGAFNWLNPMDSALYLASDEPLKLSEIISDLDLSAARLVTLSACETGITDVRHSPDEYLGLPAGFMQAGAPAVVSSLWTVDDRSTALLMERFYRNHLEKKMTFPAALREAQLWLRDATRKELGDYYKTFLRMSADDAFTAVTDIVSGGDPSDKPYANPFYWAAFTFNGAG